MKLSKPEMRPKEKNSGLKSAGYNTGKKRNYSIFLNGAKDKVLGYASLAVVIILATDNILARIDRANAMDMTAYAIAGTALIYFISKVIK